MAQQEQNQNYNYTSSGACTAAVATSSKKFKQNKVPQRGLGVAQLEKIRLEEQQKRDSVLVSPSNSVKLQVNVAIGNSSSSVINFRTEPPSNQSYRRKPLWPDEEMMVGSKRSYPFSIEDAPVPSFNCRFPPAYISHIPTADESASYSNDATFAFEQANSVLREGLTGTSGMTKYKKKIIKENGDFLTLAPPKPKDPPSYLGYYIPELPDFDALPYQRAPDDPVHWPGQIQSVEQPFLSFLPSRQNGHSTATISHSNNVVESVDLNLKL